MILLIDNYDSFVHNLARYLGELGCDRKVVRNDAAGIDELLALKPEAILLSPGPCTPKEAGISTGLVEAAAHRQIPLLGVCLGHQCIAEAFGGATVRATKPRHGKTSRIRHDSHPLFRNMPNPFPAARYHSLIAELPESGPLEPVAYAEDDGHLMALAHEHLPVFGIQFHPESILTGQGHQLLANFLGLAGITHTAPRTNGDWAA